MEYAKGTEYERRLSLYSQTAAIELQLRLLRTCVKDGDLTDRQEEMFNDTLSKIQSGVLSLRRPLERWAHQAPDYTTPNTKSALCFNDWAIVARDEQQGRDIDALLTEPYPSHPYGARLSINKGITEPLTSISAESGNTRFVDDERLHYAFYTYGLPPIDVYLTIINRFKDIKSFRAFYRVDERRVAGWLELEIPNYS